MTTPNQTGPTSTNQDQLGDGQVVHIARPLSLWLAGALARWIPRGMCGASLLAGPDAPDPGEVLPICLECVDAHLSIERNETVERVKARLSRAVERFGLDPIRPAGTWQDLSDYAAVYARLYHDCRAAQDQLDRIADECAMTRTERAAFYRRHPMIPALARQAARMAGRLSWWQERSIRAYYPPIRPRVRTRRADQ